MQLEVPTWDCMLAPTWPPWYESPLRDCTLMNKSPEFDMLKEPAEPESAQRRDRAKRAETTQEEELQQSCRGASRGLV